MINFGRKTTEAQYQNSLLVMHNIAQVSAVQMPTPPARMALNALIDHRLGEQFPVRRRAHVWDVHRQNHHRIMIGLRVFSVLRKLCPAKYKHSLWRLCMRMPPLSVYKNALSIEETAALLDIDNDSAVEKKATDALFAHHTA